MTKEEWKGYTFEDKLYVICNKLNLLGVARVFKYKVFRMKKKNLSDISNNFVVHGDAWAEMKEKFDAVIDDFTAIIPSSKKKVVFSGHILEFDKGTCNYLNIISKNLKDAEMLLISHAVNANSEKANNLIDFNYFKLPVTASLNRYDKYLEVDVPEDILQIIEEKEYLKLTVERLEMRHKDMGTGYAKALIYNLYRYYVEFLEHYKPSIVILWCEFFCGHSILKEICEEKNIEVMYMEFGALPGTFAIEKNGQMGESKVTTEYEQFSNLPITEVDFKEAKQILKYLKDSKLNRRPQLQTNVIEEIKRRYNPNYPTVVYFGQNDYEAGIQPYTERSRIFHSPIFNSSDSAAKYLAVLAKKNNWNFIYKPHQMMVRVGECLESEFPDSVIWVGDSDINELIDIADVCVTIVSQCGYISLIREKATVMLGYTQLKGKKCAYEAFEKCEIETTIKNAIADGYTQSQKQFFEKHVAQLLKYYLYDDMLEKPYRVGQGIEHAIKYINTELENCYLPKYEERKVLFICKNENELFVAKKILNNFPNFKVLDVVLQNNISSEKKLREENRFSNIFISHTKNKEEFKMYVECFYPCEIKYTDIFVSYYDESIVTLYNLLKEDEKINIHLYDSGEIASYLKNIAQDVEKNSNNNETKEFFKNICEICLFERSFFVWSQKINIPMTIITSSQRKRKTIRENLSIYYYISISSLFGEGYTSNEVDLVEEIVDLVGKERVMIEKNKYIEDKRFLQRGLTQIDCIENELEKKNDGKSIIFTMYFNKMFHYLRLNEQVRIIDLSEILISNYGILESNSFKKFINILDEREINNFYRPSSVEELKEILLYEEWADEKK